MKKAMVSLKGLPGKTNSADPKLSAFGWLSDISGVLDQDFPQDPADDFIFTFIHDRRRQMDPATGKSEQANLK